MAFSLYGQNQAGKVEVTEQEYSVFPEDFDVFLKVLGHYEKFIFEKKEKKLNETQKAFTYYYLVDGMINNSGVYSILSESLGEYNNGYLEALKISNNEKELTNYQELVKIFDKYRISFMEQEIPAALDEEHENFNEKESDIVETVESKWYDNTEERDELFKEFLASRKSDLMEIKK